MGAVGALSTFGAAWLGAADDVAVRLGERPLAVADGLTVESNTDGSDALECLREGEWSVGQVVLKAAHSGAGTLTLRLVGAADRAPVPALVRRGPDALPGARPADAQVRETYIRNAHREGEDVVAQVPYPVVPGVEDRYDLVDQSVSVDWRQEPVLEPDPKDHEPLGDRHPLVLIPGDELGDQGAQRRDARLAAFRLLRDAPAYKALLTTHKPFVFRYASYRDRAATSAALAKLLCKRFSGHIALIAHADGADLMRAALAQPAVRRRVTSAVILGEATPAVLLAGLAAH